MLLKLFLGGQPLIVLKNDLDIAFILLRRSDFFDLSVELADDTFLDSGLISKNRTVKSIKFSRFDQNYSLRGHCIRPKLA